MPEIHGDGSHPITPREKKLYEQEYINGAKLFQKALQQYSQSENPFQKEEFKKVMDEALNVLNETARELKKQTLEDQNKQITKDYSHFVEDPSDKKVLEILNQDLDKAKKFTD